MFSHNNKPKVTPTNPMLKGYVSHQERDQMRERERMSRSQIAQQASRDVFMEQASGAVFAEPIKVKRHNPQITAILGEFDRVAPIMRSEREHYSLVGADAMPCTPAPVHQDHDHLHASSPPSSPRASVALLPPPPPPPPPPAQSRALLPPPPLPPLSVTSQHSVSGRPPRLSTRPERRDRPEVMTILQEMCVPVSALVTPLKVNPPPFQYPTGSSKESAGAPSLLPPADPPAAPREQQPRQRTPLLPTPVTRPLLPPAPAPASGSAHTAVQPNLSEDLSISEDSDEATSERTAARGRTQQRSRLPHRSSHGARVPAPVESAPPPSATADTHAASSASSSDSESDSESEESGDERRPASPAPPPADSTPAAASSNPAEGKEEGSSPGTTSGGNKWSLRSIMSKEPAGTPMSSIFDDAAGRSARKLSPHDFPSSLDPADPSSLDPVDPSSLDPVDPSSAEPAEHHDDMSIEELVSQVQVPTPALLSDIGGDGSAPMDISDSSDEEPAPPPPPPASGSVRSSSGGRRPRPRLSALSESDSEKLERTRRHQQPAAEAPPRRPGRPTVKQKRPPPAASRRRSDDSDSDADTARPPPPPPPPLPSKASVKGAATGTVPRPAARGPGRPPKNSQPAPVYKSRDLLSTASESSDDETPAPSKRRRRSKQQTPPPAPLPPPPPPPAPASSSGEEAEPPPAAAARPETRLPGSDSSDSDSPPKLDAGVSTSDANKKATFSRLFSHRFTGKRGTPRGRPTTSSERSESQSSPAPAPAPAEVTVVTPAVPLPPLSRQNGVPVLRCRIEKRLVRRPESSEPTGEAAPWRQRHSSGSVGQRRRRDSERQSARHGRHRASQPAPPAAGRPGSPQAHSSSADLAAVADDGTDERRSKTSAGQTGPPDTRIESPPTGVREADSSTNPTGAQTYDINVPAALYTSQPFPIPAVAWYEPRTSGFDPLMADYEDSGDQYLKQARRLKRAADNEHDLTLKVIRYTQAVLYFLLTALSMEKEADEAEAMLAMLNDTLKLIKDILRLSYATYRKQGKRPSHIDHKLQTLLLRCQGLIYLRMFKLKEAEHKKAQRQIMDFKNQMLQESLTPDGRSYVVPRELFRLMLKCNDTQTHLRDWLDYWEQAEQLMQPTPDTGEFFAEMDRTMGGLLATSTLLELVYYIRETTRRLQDMHRSTGV